MATVHINESIRQHVKNELTMKFQPQIDTELAKLGNLDIPKHTFEQITTPELRACVDKLRQNNPMWISSASTLQTNIDVNNKRRGYAVQCSGLVFPGSGYYSTPITITPDNPIHAPMTAIYTRVDEIEKERDELIAALVGGILEKCTTLKQVLEIWPSALDFMPPEIAQRHAKPNPKRTKTGVIKQDVTVDDGTVVALTKLRLLNP